MSSTWETHCAGCDDFVAVDHTGACAWCGGSVRRRPGREGFGTLRIRDDDVDKLWQAYKAGNSAPKIAERVWQHFGFASALSCQRAIYRAFDARGLRARGIRSARMGHGAFRRKRNGEWVDPGAANALFRERNRKRRGSKQCAASTQTGAPCSKWAPNGAEYCLIHDPARRDRLAAARANRAQMSHRDRWRDLREPVLAWLEASGPGALTAAEHASGVSRITLGLIVRMDDPEKTITPRVAEKLRVLIETEPRPLAHYREALTS